MNIMISDAGIFRSDSTSYPYTETSAVKRVPAVSDTSRKATSVIRDEEQEYINKQGPAYTVEISGMGKAAIESLKSMGQTVKDTQRSSDSKLTSAEDIKSAIRGEDTQTSRVSAYDRTAAVSSASDRSRTRTDSSSDTEREEPQQPLGTKVNANNLAMYSESRLKNLVSAGSITRTDMQKELAKRNKAAELRSVDTAQDQVMQQAIAAYNFQMSFQSQAAMLR